MAKTVEEILGLAIISDKWIKGWPHIKEFLDMTNTVSIRNMTRYGFPLRYLPNGEPVIIVSEVNGWLQAFSDASSPFRLRKVTGAALAAMKKKEERGESIHVNPKVFGRSYDLCDDLPSTSKEP